MRMIYRLSLSRLLKLKEATSLQAVLNASRWWQMSIIGTWRECVAHLLASAQEMPATAGANKFAADAIFMKQTQAK